MNYREPIKLQMNENVAYIIGVLQGDGTVREYRNKNGWVSALYVSIAVGRKEADYAKIVADVIRDTFSYEARIYNEKTAIRVVISRRDIVRSLEKFKHKMEIPNEIIEAGNGVVVSYLRGLFDTDGSCYGSNRYVSGIIEFANKQERLVMQVKKYLEGIGVYSNVRIGRKKSYDPVFRLIITNKSNIIGFFDRVGFKHPKKQERLSFFVEAYADVYDRFMPKRAETAIMGILADGNEATINDIAENLHRHRETIKEHLERMEKDGKVGKRTVYFNRWGEVKKSRYKRYLWSAVRL